MKIIDLLNKIANGEIPTRIKYKDYEYSWHDKEHGYCRLAYDCTYICFGTDFNIYEILNDEIEIIEENKKIEHIGKTYDITNFRNDYQEAAQLLKDTSDKLYEIIDEVNKLKEK